MAGNVAHEGRRYTAPNSRLLLTQATTGALLLQVFGNLELHDLADQVVGHGLVQRELN